MPQATATEYKISWTLVCQVGDKVEYHPIGGASPNVASSKGEIVDIQGSGEEAKYGIKNDKTGKTTHYQAGALLMNVGPVTHKEQAKNITGKI